MKEISNDSVDMCITQKTSLVLVRKERNVDLPGVFSSNRIVLTHHHRKSGRSIYQCTDRNMWKVLHTHASIDEVSDVFFTIVKM